MKVSKTNQLFNNFFPPEVITLVTDRKMDFTLRTETGRFNPDQRKYLSGHFVFKLPKVANIRQIHGNKVLAVSKDYVSNGHAVEQADGLVTNAPGLPLVIRTADCLPVFLFDENNGCIGLVHAGWRGSQKGVVVEGMKALNKYWQSQPQHIKVAFGPAMRSCCYKVGSEFTKYFPREVSKKNDGFYLDLIKVNRTQILRMGVKEDNIFDCGICTCCDKHCFSYRREGERAGRMLSMMMIAKG